MKQIQWESGLEVKGVVRETQGFVLLGAPSPSSAFIPLSLFPFPTQFAVDYRNTAPVLLEPPPASWNSREAEKSFQGFLEGETWLYRAPLFQK